MRISAHKNYRKNINKPHRDTSVAAVRLMDFWRTLFTEEDSLAADMRI